MSNPQELPASDILYRGLVRIIAVARDSKGVAHVLAYFADDIDAEDAKRIRHTFVVIGDHGEIGANEKRFKKMEGQDFCAFKGHQARVAAFRRGDVYYLTHGFTKKSDPWPKAEIARALRIMAEHLEREGKKRK